VTRGRGGAVAVALALVVAPARVHAAEVTVPGTTARVQASGYADALAVATLGGPREHPGAITQLSLLGKISRSLRLQMTTLGRVGGPFEGAHPGIMSFVHEFQNVSPSAELNEAWGEWRGGDLQVRAGIQKFAWGKLDGPPPTDVLTPRDLHDPLVRDYEESKIGIPAIDFTYYAPPIAALALSELRASLVYVPIAVPPRLPLLEERWFPPSVASTSAVTVSQRHANEALDAAMIPFNVADDVVVPVRFHTQNHRPPAQLDAGAIAFRLGGSVRNVDWDLYQYSGPETGADAELHSSVVCDKGKACFTPTGRINLHAPTFLRQRHDVIHMGGADASTVLGGLTVRAEIAGFLDRPYLRVASDLTSPEALGPEVPGIVENLFGDVTAKPPRRGRAPVPLGPLFPKRNTIEWGIGGDYLIEGFLPLLQVNQIAFVDDGPRQLLANPDTRLLASLRRKFLQDTLELELRGVYAFERAAWFVYPRATYRWGDHWRFRVGYLGIGGPLDSVIGQYHANDEFTFEARYAF
jgi:hypothetical protein